MKHIIFRVMLSVVFCASVVEAADRLRIAYSSISGAYTGIWVAHDAGFFAKEGLDDQIILIPSATQLAQVVVSGDVDIASLGGAPVIAAVLNGADLKIIGNNVNKLIFSLHVKPEIKSIEELRGKRIAVSRFGSSSDVAARHGGRCAAADDIHFIALGLIFREHPLRDSLRIAAKKFDLQKRIFFLESIFYRPHHLIDNQPRIESHLAFFFRTVDEHLLSVRCF